MFPTVGLVCFFGMGISVSAVDVVGSHNPEEKAMMGVDAHGNMMQDIEQDPQKPMMRSHGVVDQPAHLSQEDFPRSPPALTLSGDENHHGASMAQMQQPGGFGAGASAGFANGPPPSGGGGFGTGRVFGPTQIIPCEIPRWRNGDALCLEAALQSRSFLLPDPDTGTPKLFLRDGSVCTTKCSSDHSMQSPGLVNITCAHGFWMNSRGNGVTVLKCQVLWTTYATMFLLFGVLVAGVYVCALALQVKRKVLQPRDGVDPASPYGEYGRGDLPGEGEGHEQDQQQEQERK